MQGAAGYGAAAGLPPQYDAMKAKAPLRRRAWNGRALLVALLAPWAVFVSALSVMSFPMRYESIFFGPGKIAILVNIICFSVVLAFGWLAALAWQQKKLSYGAPKPTWHTFLFGTTLLAWLLALALGDFNFEFNVSVFNEVSGLNSYHGVDVTKVEGKRMMDAGVIAFANGTRLDLAKSMGFKNKKMYCVAPITHEDKTLASYDFWAVGEDCCSEHQADFQCGEFDNPNARSGLRLISVKKREFYTLALEQAKATYGIQSSSPVFLTWMQAPDAEVDQYSGDAARIFALGALLYGPFQALLIAGMVGMLSKLGW